MKKAIVFTFVVLGCSNILYAQDAYKKRYFVKEKVKYIEKFTREDNNNVDPKTGYLFLKCTEGSIDPIVLKIANGPRGLLANVAFGKKENSNKLYINPWLISSNNGYVDRDKVYHFELQNRQSLRIRFKQWSFNALTVPLKVRFGKGNKEFTTGANLGALIGYTWGTTNFVHRKKIGNKQYDRKSTIGAFLGADKLEFSFKDDNNADVKIKTAVISTGIGYLFSYQKFTFGVTGGFDFGLGKNSSEWEFQGRPWMGISLGYSLFTF